ncbi:DNA-(apurinic or apyrimidinic site) lyase chloroplastic [Zea mays]|uniref:DNA-(Apurinic or apyrimidinic site) lyase chloroplastic n=1 Tax=Zea mays TaxID=4577 RepID=A0A1D6PTZ1_MAIZE|nr:DNA-(apurinic or apyrimidinic site) lyase chloroplastic [Zea mays]
MRIRRRRPNSSSRRLGSFVLCRCTCLSRRFSFSFQERNVDLFKNLVHEYDYACWSCSVARLGYSGTVVISRVQPISVQYGLGIPERDQEGMLITLEFDDFYLVNAYVPNSGRGLRRLIKASVGTDEDAGESNPEANELELSRVSEMQLILADHGQCILLN